MLYICNIIWKLNSTTKVSGMTKCFFYQKCLLLNAIICIVSRKLLKATKENTSSIIVQSIKTKTSKPQGIVYGTAT